MYEKCFKSDGTYNIVLVYDSGRRQVVSENQDLYQAWLQEEDGEGNLNLPVDVPYVAPPDPPPLTKPEKKVIVTKMIEEKYNASCDAGFEYNGNNYLSDRQTRDKIETGIRLTTRDPSLHFTAFTSDGIPIQINNVQLLEIQEACDDNALPIYSLYCNEMIEAESALVAALDYYIANGEFEVV